MHRWWENALGERYWLEITDRPDLGVDLKAPQTADNGSDYWSYSLVTCVREGDVVLHYHAPQNAITAYSWATGTHWAEDIVWASHGTVARTAGVSPYLRPGWRIGLEGFTPLTRPLPLSRIRQHEATLRDVARRLEHEYGRPIYFPFAMSGKRPPRPAQGYLTKFPAALVSAFEELAELAGASPPVSDRSSRTSSDLGSAYRPASEDSATSDRDPFSVDPAIVERGLRGHAATQNALAAWVRSCGFEPRSPTTGEPNFDVAWRDGWTVYVAEVKSITEANEEKQLRLGLGQVLRYRQLVSHGGHRAKAVLAVERKPRDDRWLELCEQLDVWLVWPNLLQHVTKVNTDI